jgi:hypothetical protein
METEIEKMDNEKTVMGLDIGDIRKISIGAVKSFHECDVAINGTSIKHYALMKCLEDVEMDEYGPGIEGLSRYIEAKRSSEKSRPVTFKLATDEEAKVKDNWIKQRARGEKSKEKGKR